jgi:hypothetical protein
VKYQKMLTARDINFIKALYYQIPEIIASFFKRSIYAIFRVAEVYIKNNFSNKKYGHKK